MVSSEKNELFQLIKSLKQSEKRYFKIYASQQIKGEKNNYVKLFEAIDKQKEYNEEKIRKSLLLDSKKISVTKNYLYQLVLKSLRNYHVEMNSNLKIYNWLAEAEILYDKSLINQSAKLVAKAEKLAQTLQKNVFLPVIYRFKRLLIHKEIVTEKGRNEVKKILKKEIDVLRKIENLNSFTMVHVDMFKFYKEYDLCRNREEKRLELESFKEKNLIFDADKALSFDAEISRLQTNFLYFITVDDLKMAYEAVEKSVILYESHLEQLPEQFYNYLFSVFNEMSCAVSLRKFSRARVLNRKMQDLPRLYPHLVTESILSFIFKQSVFVYTIISIETADYNNCEELSEKALAGIEKYNSFLSEDYKIKLYYNLADLLFCKGNYKKALFWLNKIINETDCNVRQDYHSFARIFRIILHYELNNYDVLESIVKSTYRFLSKCHNLFQFEKVILAYLTKFLTAGEGPKIKGYLSQLYDDLLAFKDDPHEKKAFETFDVLSWLESKKTNIALAEIKKRKITELKLQ